MPKVSISRAAKLAGISRQQLYQGYIKTGKISVERDNPKKPRIDTAEIIRVFGALQDDSQSDDKTLHNITPSKSRVYSPKLDETVKELTDRITILERENSIINREVELLRGQNDDLKEDRDRWRHQATALLEAPRQSATGVITRGWQWLFGKERTA